ncbi:gliding motility-associated C-terminal domain-containing protein [Lishizhenia tianjinensis]|uniref:gliding motility-associated C-terminal domain-containing protein n=1 Tax=Lishizhenia tianjinensis TaxID=477690 RepID=UPI000B7DA94D|nr:gliding motility-associated C-terminal domain-containing protein [Lishizhenia tianjinensis]
MDRVYTYTFIDNACLDTLTSIVSFYPALSFSPDTLVCDSISNVAVFNSENAGSWSSDSLQITFVSPNDTITDVFTSEYGNYKLYYTDNICGSTDTINITFAYPPRTNFIDTVVCDSSFQVVNVDSWNGGTWSNPFPDVITIIEDTLDNPLIELDTAGTFEFIYTDNQCSVSDTLRISFYGEPQIIGQDTLCGLQNEIYLADTMYAGGVWTTSDPANISVNDPFSSDTVFTLAQNYGTYTIYFTDNHCNKTDSLAQIYIEPANITGASDTITCDGIHQVAGIVAPNGGTWANPDPNNITINSDTDNNPLITLNTFGTYNFVFTQNTCGNVVDIDISYFDAPTINGADTVCGLTSPYTVSNAYPSGGSWSTTAPEISFSSSTTANTDITATTYGSYWVYYEENYCNKEDSLFITFLPPAVTNSLQDTVLCGSTYQVTGVNSLSGGVWTNPSPSDLTFSDLAVNNPLITVNNFGTYTITFTQNTCPNTESFTLTYLDKPEILANDTTCNTVINLTIASNFPAGGVWSTNAPEVSLNTPTSTATNATSNTPGSYWVYYTENNCGTQDSILLTYASAPVFNLSDTTICDNLYPVSGVSSFNGGTWNASDASVLFSDENVDNPNITLLNPGTYTITFTDDQCGASNQFDITLIADPQIVGSASTCTDDLNLSLANSFVQGGSWSTNSTDLSIDNPTSDAVTISNTNDGTYWVYYTENQCNHVDSLEVTFYGPPEFTLTDSLICDTIFTAIGVTSTNGGTWTVIPNSGATVLTPNDDNPDLQFFQTGEYTFVYTDNQCGFTDSVTYDFVAYPQATITENMVICPNQVPVQIEVDNLTDVDSLVWFNGSEADSVLIESEGYWTVQLFNDCHIREMGTQILFDFCGVEVPNVITPNGDNMNDVLTLNIGEIDEFYMLIVNRWGNVVYESNDATEAWDGTNKNTGTPCSDGTYFYKVTYKQTAANQMEMVEGFVTVIRN